MSRRFLLAGCVALSLGTAQDTTFVTLSTPSVILWAWERPEDLRFLASYVGPSFSSGTFIAVAFLDRTLVVRIAADRDSLPAVALAQAGVVESLKRRQPLRVSSSTALIAVVRIEGRGGFDDRVLARLSSEIIESARLPRVSMVQIDFDATRSQRPVYQRLLHDVRSRLPHGIKLSVTALASWCNDDPWIDAGSVDEIVPMLFRMGPDARWIATRLREDRRWPVAACNGAVGVSMDERWSDLPLAPRVYVFNPRAWREEDWFTTQRLLNN